jgi:hypothetical protein
MSSDRYSAIKAIIILMIILIISQQYYNTIQCMTLPRCFFDIPRSYISNISIDRTHCMFQQPKDLH